MSGRRRSSTTPSIRLAAHRRQRFRTGCKRSLISTSSCASNSTTLIAFGLIVLDDEQLLDAARGVFLDLVEGDVQAVGRDRLDHVGERAVLQAVLAFLLDGHDLHREYAAWPDRV